MPSLTHAVLASLAFLGPGLVSGELEVTKEEFECPPDIANCIQCKSKAIAFGFSKSRDALVDLGAKIGAYLCGGDTSIDISIEVNDLAYAVAEAAAFTSVQCEGTGDVEGSGKALARATASAEASAVAVAEGFLTVDTCNGCEVAIGIFAAATKTVFVEAFAESQSEIESFVPKPLSTSRKEIFDFVVARAKAIIPVYASVLADITSKVHPGEDTCDATLVVCAETGDEGGCCDITIELAKQEIGQNAYVEVGAIAEISDAFCAKEDLAAFAGAAATATASVFVEALAKLYGYCESTTSSLACAWGAGSIEAVAEAEAEAIAVAISSVTTCDCNLDTVAVAASFKSILVSAIAAVQVEACAIGEAKVDVEAMSRVVKAATAEAFAVAFAAAFDTCTGGGCAATEIAVPRSPEDSTSAGCCVVADTLVATHAEDALAVAVAEAAAYLCSDKDDGAFALAEASATALAEACALAIAALNIECSASDGYSFACGAGDVTVTAIAEATAVAFAQAWAASEICKECSVEAKAVIKEVQPVVAKAVASVWAGQCTSGKDSFDISAFSIAFAEASLEVTATAIAAAAANPDNGKCDIVISGCVGDNANPAGNEETCCAGVLTAFPVELEQDNAFGEAEAEAFAGGYLCKPTAEAEAFTESFVRVVATAWAKVVTFAVVDCEAPEKGAACFWGKSHIEDTAEAFATAVAKAWAGAISDCGCVAQADALAEITKTAVADVTLDVLIKLCAEDGEGFTVALFIEAIVKDQVAVFADAMAAAKVDFTDDGEARCAALAEASVGEAPVPEAAP